MELLTAKQQLLNAVLTALKNKIPLVDNVSPEVAARNKTEFENYKVMVQEEVAFFERTSREYVQDYKARLLRLMDRLFELRKKRSAERIAVLLCIVEHLDLPEYPAVLRDAYACGKKLASRLDYFFSYTNKGAPSINNTYKKAIRSEFGRNSEVNAQWEKANYLGRLIERYFRILRLHGFFDRESMVEGDIINDEVIQSCRESITFIQFVEQRSFETDPANNWCFREYSTYRADRNHRYLFYKHAVLGDPGQMDEPMQQWYEFAATDKGALGVTIDFNWSHTEIQMKVNEHAKTIRDEISSQFQTYLTTLAKEPEKFAVSE